MGGIFWKSSTAPSTNPKAEKYYQGLISNDLSQDSAREKVQLTLSIQNCEAYTSYIVSSHIAEEKEEELRVAGITEEEQSNAYQGTINFKMTFIIDYYFERNQKIVFRVNKGSSSNFMIESTIANLMGSRGQTLSKVFGDGEILVVVGRSLVNNNKNVNLSISLNGFYKDSSLFYVIKSGGEARTNVYKSEIKHNSKSGSILEFEPTKIPAMILCNGDFSNTAIILEFHNMTEQSKIGEHITTVDKLSSNESKFVVNPPQGLSKYAQAFNVEAKCKVETAYTFVDYLRGGMQLALTIGIDFTASNQAPNNPNSLHYITQTNLNAYQRAIRSCGDIVAYYDYDQLFPTFGYGAILPGKTNVSHCFPLNMSINNNDPNIKTIDGVLETYMNVVPILKFHGPTYFAPLITELIDTVNNDLKEGKTYIYNILMILTDGQINDMANTIDALVEASYMPISVIIIGIGNGDFGNMDILDADNDPLFDKHGRQAGRDLVQFVPFHKYENNGRILAEQVLEEIPRQVIEYYQMIKMPPGDPIVNVII